MTYRLKVLIIYTRLKKTKKDQIQYRKENIGNKIGNGTLGFGHDLKIF